MESPKPVIKSAHINGTKKLQNLLKLQLLKALVLTEVSSKIVQTLKMTMLIT